MTAHLKKLTIWRLTVAVVYGFGWAWKPKA